jgi:hypothetical protein
MEGRERKRERDWKEILGSIPEIHITQPEGSN